MPYFALCLQPIVYLRINKSKTTKHSKTIFLFLTIAKVLFGKFRKKTCKKKKWRHFSKEKKSRRKNQGFQFLMGFMSGSGYNIKNLGPSTSWSQKNESGRISHYFLWKIGFWNFWWKKTPSHLSSIKTSPSTPFQLLWREEKNAQNTTWCM